MAGRGSPRSRRRARHGDDRTRVISSDKTGLVGLLADHRRRDGRKSGHRRRRARGVAVNFTSLDLGGADDKRRRPRPPGARSATRRSSPRSSTPRRSPSRCSTPRASCRSRRAATRASRATRRRCRRASTPSARCRPAAGAGRLRRALQGRPSAASRSPRAEDGYRAMQGVARRRSPTRARPATTAPASSTPTSTSPRSFVSR